MTATLRKLNQCLRLTLLWCVLAEASAQGDDLEKDFPPIYATALREAIRHFHAHNYDAALLAVDRADKLFVESTYSLNIRGAIAIERRRFEEGAKFCYEALKKDPKFFPAKFNLAEIPFLKAEYPQARAILEELLAADPRNELLLYRIYLTHLLEKNDALAQAALEKMPFPSNTAAYYYAHAAWSFAHGDEKAANEWIRSGDWVFPAARNVNFIEVFYNVGWLKRPGDGAESNSPQ